MPDVAYTVEYDGVKNKVIKWVLTNGQAGAWYPFAGRYPDKTMHVFGTAGSGLHVKPYGTNEAVAAPTSEAQLEDATEDLIDITAVPAVVVVLPNTHQIRPKVAGDGTTAITVMMELKA
jgi:hypothetical protein